MARVRQDYRIITHRVLRQAPAVMDKILPIDFDETPAALANNLQTRAAAHQHLKDGGAVIIFPAGAISLAPNVVGKAIDTDWKTFAAKLAMTPDTTTVPFFFDGRNSLLYQMARRISVTLGYSLMFREICKKIGQPITVHVRQPVHSDQLCAGITPSDNPTSQGPDLRRQLQCSSSPPDINRACPAQRAIFQCYTQQTADCHRWHATRFCG